MAVPQFNARVKPDTITKIKQLQVSIGKRNTPPADLSQAAVMDLAVKMLHDHELGQSGKIPKKSRQTA